MSYVSLHDRLRKDIAQKLMKDLDIKNVHALPRLQKIVVNVGINRSKMEGKEILEYISDSLKRITGQKSVFTKARKAISNFKTREGLTVGAVVTLRGKHMEEFLDRLLSYVLPRIRDFRGLPSKLDGHGNYALGLNDHTIFPEIATADNAKGFGMQIQLSISGGSDKASRALLEAIGMPFMKSKRVAEAEANRHTDRPS